MRARILAVEDSPTQAEALVAHLRAGGHEVRLAPEGEEALRLFRPGSFDLVVSDVVMPGDVDGYELCRRIKARDPETPVILLTSLSDPLDIIHGLEAGADNFLTKPYETDQLLDRIDLLLRNRKLRAGERLRTGVRVFFRGRDYVINSEREQILDLLVTTFEEAVDQNRKLVAREEELTRAREELSRYARSLEAQLSAILGSVPDAVFAVDPHWRSLQYISPGAREVFGCDVADFSVAYWRDRIHPEDRPRVEADREAVVATGQRRTFEYRFRNGGPESRRILETVAPVPGDEGVVRIHGIARDVTEQWKARRQLELSDTILRNVGNVVVVADETGSIQYVSPSVEAMTGYRPDELLGDGWWSALYADDGPAMRSGVVAIARGERPSAREPYENTLRDRVGRPRTFLWTDARGPGGLVIGVGSDITDRKIAQERLERIAASEMVGILYYDLDGRVLEANDEFLRIVGYTREDVEAGRVSWSAMTPPEYRSRDQEAIAQIAANGKCTPFRKEFHRKDGSRVPIIIGAASFESAPEQGVAFIIDITDQSAAEDALRRQTRHLRLLQEVTEEANRAGAFDEALGAVLDTVCDGIGWPVGHAYVAEVHQGAAVLVPSAVWHLEEEDRFAAFRSRSMETSFHRGEGLAGRVWASGRAEWVADLRQDEGFVRQDDPAVLSGVAVPVSVGDETVALLEFFHHERREEDPDLLSLLRQVGIQLGRVAERERAHHRQREVEAQARQSQKLEAVGRLAGGIAHDFNNLLTVMVTEAGMALAFGNAPPEVRESLEEIRKASERAKLLTSKLLAFSRGGTSELEAVDVNDVVRGMESMLRRLLREDITFTTSLMVGLPLVMADPGELEQVLMNLVVNAQDAMPDGGRILVETYMKHLHATDSDLHGGLEPGLHVVLAVSDTGMGMTQDVQAHLFEPFFTTKEVGKGTGLGLATSYGIVSRLNGYINVYSELGEGSVFRVYLPASGAGRADQEVSPADRELKGGTETVLVVEDDPHIRSVAERVLKVLGYDTLVAADGAQALALVEARGHPVDLLFTDVVLPGIGGGKLAELMADRWPGLRVLYTSGYTQDIALKTRVETGAATLLQKPYTVSELARRVRAVLDGE